MRQKSIKSTTAMPKLSKKSPLNIDLDNIDRLANFSNLKYALLREVIEITTEKLNVCNEMLHSTTVNRWRQLFNFKP